MITHNIDGVNCDLAETLRTLDSECRNCMPPTPIECIARCNVWRLKNEFRQLREAMDKPNFMKALLNTLKNETRLQVLKAIANRCYSADQLEQAFREAGRNYSAATISEEYLRPLAAVGLATETMNHQFYATIFGRKLVKRIDGFSEIVRVLPAHSECYEETVLTALLSESKTFKELAAIISAKVATRVLKRLKTAGLIETPRDKYYVFFFKTKRNPEKETLSLTERKVYEAILEEGISAKKLADKTGLSLRRTYVCLRRLKGKKLVFVRRTPKTYGLTAAGAKLATLLRDLQNLVEEIWNTSTQVVKGENA
ncbi:MAG: hypothetical protein N3E52_05045 [Candidatus Bathyarchaeota archaeon]|nr:hypothetical protein [Candidatus Bathyarchaeota archaeon]